MVRNDIRLALNSELNGSVLNPPGDLERRVRSELSCLWHSDIGGGEEGGRSGCETTMDDESDFRLIAFVECGEGVGWTVE